MLKKRQDQPLQELLLIKCSSGCLIWSRIILAICIDANCLQSRGWLYAARVLFLLVGGVESIVFGSIRRPCVWSLRPSSPLRLPQLKFLFVFVCSCLLLFVAELMLRGKGMLTWDTRGEQASNQLDLSTQSVAKGC